MRRPVPSFVTEFKTRSFRSSARRPSTKDDSDADGSKPFFLDTAAFFAGQKTDSRGREDAMRAADAVFGVRNAATPDSEKPPSSVSPVGRVLPSLIDADDVLTVRLREADKQRRRGRKPGTAATASVVRREKPILRPQHNLAPAPIEPPVADVNPEQSLVPARRRERSSIQKRWVLKTEPKAGEKWKRRLHNAAKYPPGKFLSRTTGPKK
jgi:hypothetical protein